MSFIYDFLQESLSTVAYEGILTALMGENMTEELIDLYPPPTGLHSDCRPVLCQVHSLSKR